MRSFTLATIGLFSRLRDFLKATLKSFSSLSFDFLSTSQHFLPLCSPRQQFASPSASRPFLVSVAAPLPRLPLVFYYFSDSSLLLTASRSLSSTLCYLHSSLHLCLSLLHHSKWHSGSSFLPISYIPRAASFFKIPIIYIMLYTRN